MSTTSTAEHLARLFENPHTSVVVTNVLAIGFFVGFVALAFLLVEKDTKSGQSRAANCLILFLGFLVGWALALFWVPFDDTEKTVFAQVGATVSAFVAGYGISKFDKLLESTLYQDGKAPRRLVWNPTMAMVERSRGRWACGQGAKRLVHMSTGRH